METDIALFVQGYNEELHSVEVELGLAYWEMETTGSEPAKRRVVDAEIRSNAVFLRPDDWATIRSAFDSRASIADANLRRQVELLYYQFAANQDDPERFEKRSQLGADVGGDFTSFRSTVGGTKVSDNEVNTILRESRSSAEVEEAWKAGKEIGPVVAQRVVELAQLRNAFARDTGYANFYEQQLAFQEIRIDDLFDLLRRLDEATREPFARSKGELDRRLATKFGVTVDDLRPWHYANPFFQEPPPLTEVTLDPIFAEKDVVSLSIQSFDRLGLDTRDILERSDLYEREGKNQHAFCIDIDRLARDVRVLCNCRSDEYWMTTMLHELGHAVYDKYLGGELPYLLKTPAHINSTEAIAMLMGRLTRNQEWLREVAGASADDAESLGAAAQRDLSFQMLTFVRWILVMTNFERALYENPGRPNLNELWWNLVSNFQRLPIPEGRTDAEGKADWASKIHVALYPAYYHNYVIGELTASQIQDVLESRFGNRWFLDTGSGDFLREKLFALGACLPWDKTVVEVTGEPLDPSHFAEQFVGR